MAKKSASELKAEGADLGALIATARKRPLNFALLIGGDGVVLEAHPTKGADVMRRMAKANGGGTRGIQGVMNVSGKVIELTSEDDDVPGTLAKAAKRHLKERGLAFKVAIILPGGARMDDGEDDTNDNSVSKVTSTTETENEAKTPDEPDTATTDEPSADADSSGDRKAELSSRLKGLIPEVKRLVEQKVDGAEKFGRGLQVIAAELAKESLDRAQQLLNAIEKGIADAKRLDVPKVDAEALRAQLKTEFDELAEGAEDLKSRAEKGVAGKADQLAKMFNSLVESEDLKRAGAVLTLFRTFVNSELGKLAEASGNIFDQISDTVSELADDAKELVEKGVEAVDDFVDGLTEEGRKKLDLQALGFSEEDQDRLVAELATNPNAIKQAKAKLVDDTGLPATERAALKKLAETDPKAFAAALDTFKVMDASGPVDVSPEKVLESVEALEAARKAQIKAVADLAKATTELAAIKGGTPLPGSDWAKAIAAAAAAEKAFRDFGAGLPKPSEMSDSQRRDAMVKGMELDRLRKEAAEAVKDAKAVAEKNAEDASAAANEAVTKASAKKDEAQKDMDAKDAKRGLMDALSFGRLSPGAKPAFKDEDKASFIAAYAKDGKLADAAMDVAARSENPSAVAQNVGFVADKMKDGFAAPDGKKLDLPQEDLRKMANNALRMGGLQGEDYFKGFGDYLKSGKQLEPDPHGGLSEPLDDSDAETQRLNKIALNRTSGLGAAALKDGKVDFESPEAKGAMDHMMFHPGSLKTFTPQMNQKMAETKGLFSDPKTADKANEVIGGTKLPSRGEPGRRNSQKIIAGTMGKSRGAVTDDDAKASVLSAMMTPLSQGPVGSCFSTAPVRAVRETDPLRAMGEYSKIASTGLFTSKAGKTYPANVNPPKGENPLMRSWEYSVATAAAELTNSRERNSLNAAMMPSTVSNASLTGIRSIVGADKWRSKTDPNTGLQIPGVRAKLRKAMNKEMKFEYNAGPPIGTPPATGGDGSSTDGGYEIKYKGKALKSEADFIAAIQAIALAAAGERAGTTDGDGIIALVTAPEFRDGILAAYGGSGAAPWNLAMGGFENQTDKVLDGGNPQITGLVGANNGTPPKTQTQRSVELLNMVLGQSAPGSKDMQMLSTRGTNADHAFNGLPNHPSLDKIKDPNSAAKVQSELIGPGQKMATDNLPADQAAKLFEDELRALAEGAAQDERDLLIEALKKRPTTDMTPGKVKEAVVNASRAYRYALAQKRADAYQTEKEPAADNARKRVIRDFFRDQVKGQVAGGMDTALAAALQPPEVVIADTNWGDPASQIYFVMSPDPSTGDLVMWKKDKFSGKLTPAGKNWEDSNWYKVQ